MSQVAEINELVSPRAVAAVATRAEQETAVASSAVASSAVTLWEQIIDHTLIMWGANPSVFADEEFDGPGREVIRLAIEIAKQYARDGKPAPDRVVPDADGGIVFERRQGILSEKIHIWDDGLVEYIQLHGTRVVERYPLELP